MRRLHTTMAAFVLAVAFAAPAASQVVFYEFELIAQIGDSLGVLPPLTDFRHFPSINNDGTVAFSADFGVGGGGIFTSSGGMTTPSSREVMLAARR